jgi:acyl carrier protein
MERLPFTPNGKVDRAALLEVDRTAREQDRSGIKPRNTIEETLASIWRDLLERQNITVSDNFFELGGHSLFAVQLVAQIQKRLGITIPLRSVFESATIAELGTLITDLLQKQSNVAVDGIVRRERGNIVTVLTNTGRLSNAEAKILAANAAGQESA